ncbi:BTB/POZ domain-containing protein kctd16 [Gaertneriomyces sp. JEL0708]|nr:BTB/POZ domain-containing protein kctd16 [Gaertneriomyces sp. JEL0708]
MSFSGITKDLVTFNVGGKLFTTTRSNINAHPDSMLANLIAHTANGDSQQEIFIDRDPDTFAVILQYVRTGVVDITGHAVSPAGLAADGAFYYLPEVVAEAKKLLAAASGPPYYLYSCSQLAMGWVNTGARHIKIREMHRITAVDATSVRISGKESDLVSRLDNWRRIGASISLSFFDSQLTDLLSTLNADREEWAIQDVKVQEHPTRDGDREFVMYCLVRRL